MDINKLSRLFSPGFIERGKTYAIERKILECIDRGHSPYQMLENICIILNETNERFTNLVINGPQPNIIFTTQEHFDKLTDEAKKRT